MSRRLVLATLLPLACLLLALGTAGAAAADDATAPAAGAVSDGMIVFYFHGNARCTTCRTIEAYTGEAIQTGFAEELTVGALTWGATNVQQPENRHFIQDFQLTNKSVVLAEYHDGKVVRFKNLDKVWQLVRNKDRFVAYVQDETRAFLEAS